MIYGDEFSEAVGSDAPWVIYQPYILIDCMRRDSEPDTLRDRQYIIGKSVQPELKFSLWQDILHQTQPSTITTEDTAAAQ